MYCIIYIHKWLRLYIILYYCYYCHFLFLSLLLHIVVILHRKFILIHTEPQGWKGEDGKSWNIQKNTEPQRSCEVSCDIQHGFEHGIEDMDIDKWRRIVQKWDIGIPLANLVNHIFRRLFHLVLLLVSSLFPGQKAASFAGGEKHRGLEVPLSTLVETIRNHPICNVVDHP